jgi:hypothetical protein
LPGFNLVLILIGNRESWLCSPQAVLSSAHVVVGGAKCPAAALHFTSHNYEIVVEMISELPDPLNARGGPVKLYRPAISYISIYKGLDGPFELKESPSKLNIRGVAE